MFDPKVEILPGAQRSLWPRLKETPRNFVLYGGTAMALRLGHRQSEDFDFFSIEAFETSDLLYALSYLKDARVDQRGDNTLTVMIDGKEPVKVSFFGDLRMNHVQEPDVSPDNEVQIASLLDLTATKLNTIQHRAEAKDYRDIAAALESGISLLHAIAAARAIYGKKFNAMVTLKALTYFEDGNLATLLLETRDRLRKASESIRLEAIPVIEAASGITRNR